jgi:transposase
MPPVEQRDLRALTRDRTTLVQERTRASNRVPGVLARATIKLASVATASMGVSGRALLAALIEGRADPAPRAELATGRLRAKIPVLEQALTGLVRDHHRRLLAMQVAHLDVRDEPLEAFSADITRLLTELRADPTPPSSAVTGGVGEVGSPSELTGPTTPLTSARAVTVLDTIPGVDQRGGELWVAAWGIDRARCGTAARLAAWSGVAPGNDESAGQQRSGKTRKGYRALRTGLTPLAHAAALTRGTYVSALSQRLAARRGKKRAIMAVAHSIVVSAFPMLSRHEP